MKNVQKVIQMTQFQIPWEYDTPVRRVPGCCSVPQGDVISTVVYTIQSYRGYSLLWRGTTSTVGWYHEDCGGGLSSVLWRENHKFCDGDNIKVLEGFLHSTEHPAHVFLRVTMRVSCIQFIEMLVSCCFLKFHAPVHYELHINSDLCNQLNKRLTKVSLRICLSGYQGLNPYLLFLFLNILIRCSDCVQISARRDLGGQRGYGQHRILGRADGQ